MSKYSIRVQGVTKQYQAQPGQRWFRDYVRDAALNSPGTSSKTFTALRNVSFELPAGESLAIVGRNGAGKSTLLNLIAGLTAPEMGTVEVHGRLGTLLDIGAGFHPELTGRENVAVNAALLGLTKEGLAKLEPRIMDFADIGDFFDQPLRTYSVGMAMRLAFAVNAFSDPDVLLVDEVLAVGDAGFQRKCLDWVMERKRQGGTFVCVSHAIGGLEKLCEHCLWLRNGEVAAFGPFTQVMDEYHRSLAGSNHAA